MNHRRGENICHSQLHSTQQGVPLVPLKNCNNFPYRKHQAMNVYKTTACACGRPVLTSASQSQPQLNTVPMTHLEAQSTTTHTLNDLLKDLLNELGSRTLAADSRTSNPMP